jgi:hypothetical protein
MLSKYAPFAMINRLLPHPISKWLLHILIPGSEGRLGFRAYYDRTYKSGMKRVLEKHDFKIIDIKVNYYQAEYFNFFVPLFVLNVLYELIVYGLRLENLGASVLVVARGAKTIWSKGTRKREAMPLITTSAAAG